MSKNNEQSAIALVTGSGRGLGRGIAIELAKKMTLSIQALGMQHALFFINITKGEPSKRGSDICQFLMSLFIFYSGLNIKQRPLLQNLLPDSLGPSLKT